MNQSRHPRMSKLALGLVVALAAAPSFAQSTSAGVGGTVTDTSGQAVAGAEVTITHVESGTVSRATTDASGRYTARGLRVGGPYTIVIVKSGAGTTSEDNVFLTLNQINTVDAALTGDLTTLETVTAIGFTGGSEVFSATKMGSGTSVNRQMIEALPSVAGNIQDYMRLDPRVAFTDRASGSMSAGGQNPRFNKITIDGVSASDTFGLEGNNMPTQRQPVSMEAIEAIDINLSNYDVSMSGAAGANVNAVTKSGTNEFHGSVYGTYRDGDWFGDYPARIAGATANIAGQAFDEFNDETTWGVTLGGPIIKDKLFFFVNYEKFKATNVGPAGQSGGTAFDISGADFSAADLAAVQDIANDVWGFDPGGLSSGGDTELEEYAIKLDWNINDDHRASFRYSNLDQTRVRPETGSASILSLSSSWYTHAKSVESYSGQLFSDWSDNFSTEFKASYRDYSAVRVNPTTAPAIQVYFDDGIANGNDNPIGTNGNTIAGLDGIRLGTERSSMGNTLLTETWNYFGAATWTLGDHDVKFGAEYSENDIYNFFLQDAWGNYSFYVPRPLVNGVRVSDFTRLVNGQYFDYDLQTNPTNPDAIAARYKNKNTGLFVQDTWYVTSNLTLTFGVRADKPEASPSPPFNACFAAAPGTTNTACGTGYTGGFGIDNTYTYNGDYIIQPRFGFNYTFDSERPMQLRGGVGLFQGDAPQVWVGNAYSSTGLNYTSFQNVTTWQTVPFSADGLNPSIPPGGSGVRNVNAISSDFELPSVWKANLAIDVETPWNGIVASAELLLTDVNNGLFYNTLNVGPGYTDSYGRTLYWNPASPRPFGNTATGATPTNPARFNRNGYFGDVYLLENTDQGRGQQFTVSLTKPFSTESDWSWMLGYTYTNAEEVAALTSSTASSGFSSQLGFNINEPTTSTARYEIKDRFSGALNWSHKFFGDHATQVGLFYEGRSGRPFSYVFVNDANGDTRSFNDLFYVPTGPGDVLFGSMNATTGAFTANPAMEAAFWSWMADNPELKAYSGTYAPENAFRAGWVNTFDIRVTQELPGFFKGHKSKVWLDIQNIGNLLNKDWGHIVDYGFNANQGVATLIGMSGGKYVYGYRGNFNGSPEFGQSTAQGIPTNSDSQTNGISQWSLQFGLKYEF